MSDRFNTITLVSRNLISSRAVLYLEHQECASCAANLPRDGKVDAGRSFPAMWMGFGSSTNSRPRCPWRTRCLRAIQTTSANRVGRAVTASARKATAIALGARRINKWAESSRRTSRPMKD